MSDSNVILSCESISKSFFGNEVLHDVSLQCKKGVALALVGENGAGKSTLINIISGNLKADKGTIYYFGAPVRMKNPQMAKEEGIAVVHQQNTLIPELSVAENMFLGQENKFGKVLINNDELHKEAQKEVDEHIEFKIDVRKAVAQLTPAERQMIEILKAWLNRPKMLIFDEPTSSLSKNEVEHLFSMIRKLKEQGASIVFITHRMDEIFAICDEAVVLKDGSVTKKAAVKDITKDQLISAMVGREKSGDMFPERASSVSENKVLELKNVEIKGHLLHHVNLALHEGEIVGLAGLEGQGQRYLARAIFGIEPFISGEMKISGKQVHIKTPKSAMKHGIAFIPDDRDLEGTVKVMSVSNNLTLATLKEISDAGVINTKKSKNSVAEGIELLSIKTASPNMEIAHLSGGNQQKVIFSKWLKTRPKIIVLHEPTRGIDVKTKEEIYRLLRRLSSEGVAILVVSSDMIELIGISDRIVVMYEGEIMGEVPGADATEEKIMTLSSGERLA